MKIVKTPKTTLKRRKAKKPPSPASAISEQYRKLQELRSLVQRFEEHRRKTIVDKM
jgi:hypothetical protein